MQRNIFKEKYMNIKYLSNSILFQTRKIHSLHPNHFKSSFIKQGLGPAPPQVIVGSVNDPSPTPTPSPIHGSYHWAFERLISITLVPLIFVQFMGLSTTPILNAILSLALVVHSHIGFNTCITDYFPKREYGSFSTFMRWLLRSTTGLVFLGLYEFETNDVGIIEGMKRIWKS